MLSYLLSQRQRVRFWGSSWCGCSSELKPAQSEPPRPAQPRKSKKPRPAPAAPPTLGKRRRRTADPSFQVTETAAKEKRGRKRQRLPVCHPNRRGRPPKPPPIKSRPIVLSHSDMQMIMNFCDMSQKDVDKLARALRFATKNRKVIAPRLREAIRKMTTLFDDIHTQVLSRGVFLCSIDAVNDRSSTEAAFAT